MLWSDAFPRIDATWYFMPVPEGGCRVVKRFAELFWQVPCCHNTDMAVEGMVEEAAYEPLQTRSAAKAMMGALAKMTGVVFARTQTAERKASDGSVDVIFLNRKGDPEIAANDLQKT